MRRIEADRPRLFAPGLAFDPLAGQAGVEDAAYGEHIGTLVDLAGAIDFGRGVTVIEDGVGLQFVVVADVIQAGQLDASVRSIRQRGRAYIIDPHAAIVQVGYCLTELDGGTQRLMLSHRASAALPRRERP